jgi:hypothetical protein
MRMTGRCRRHVHDCAGCRDFRHGLRGERPPWHGVFGAVAQVLGIGGGGSGAAVGAGTVAVSAPVAAKLTALVWCAAVIVAGAEPKAHPTRATPAAPHAPHGQRTAAAAPGPLAAAVLRRVDRRAGAAAASAPVHRDARRAVARLRRARRRCATFR